MFYIKQGFGYADVITEIRHDNVFAKCAECGREFAVDLAKLFVSTGDGDLYSTAVLCEECSKEVMPDV